MRFGDDNQSTDEDVECWWWGRSRDERIAAMNCIEAELAVDGIAAGRVADEVADGDNLQDRQKERGEQDAEALGRRGVVTAEIVSPTKHVSVIAGMSVRCKPPNLRKAPGIPDFCLCWLSRTPSLA